VCATGKIESLVIKLSKSRGIIMARLATAGEGRRTCKRLVTHELPCGGRVKEATMGSLLKKSRKLGVIT